MTSFYVLDTARISEVEVMWDTDFEKISYIFNSFHVKKKYKNYWHGDWQEVGSKNMNKILPV